MTDAVKRLGGKFLLVAHESKREPACLIEGALQHAFEDIRFGLRLWRAVAAGVTNDRLKEDPVCVFLTYFALDEPAVPDRDGVIRQIKCQGIWVKVQHKKSDRS
jgi:hypothetical protein